MFKNNAKEFDPDSKKIVRNGGWENSNNGGVLKYFLATKEFKRNTRKGGNGNNEQWSRAIAKRSLCPVLSKKKNGDKELYQKRSMVSTGLRKRNQRSLLSNRDSILESTIRRTIRGVLCFSQKRNFVSEREYVARTIESSSSSRKNLY